MESMQNNITYFDNSHFFQSDEQFHIQLSTDYPAYVGVMHRHQFIEIVYILSGSAEHHVGNRHYHVKTGDVVVINTNVPHCFQADAGNDPFVAYDLMFTPDFYDATDLHMDAFESLKNSFLFYSLYPDEVATYPDLHISGQRYTNYGEIFTRIHQEFKRKEMGYIALIRAYCVELIIKVFRDLERTGTVALSSDKLKLVSDIIEEIQHNYHEKISVDKLAAKVFLSPDYFRKLFKKATGETVLAFQQRIRIDEACRMLSTTDIPIKDICAAIGYQDVKSFYILFKKVTGKTPQEYRNNQ